MDRSQTWSTSKLKTLLTDFIVPMRDKPPYWAGETPWCRIEDIDGKYLAGSKSHQVVDDETIKLMNLKVFPAGTVLCSCSARLGVCAIVARPLVSNQTFIGLVPGQDLDAEFLYYKMSSKAALLQSLSSGTTIAYLPRAKFESFEIAHPRSTVEQAKIAEILSTVDRAIEQTEGLIAKQQRIKIGLMQDLLTRGIDENGAIRSEATHQFKESPFGQIPEEWDVTSATDLCDAVLDCKNRTPPLTDEGHPVIRTPNVRGGQFVFADLVYTDPHSYEVWVTRGRPRPGDVVITREAPFGEACQIPSGLESACLGQRMMMYQTNQAKLRADYLVLAIYSEVVQSKLLELAGGSTVGHIRVGDIRKLPIPHPKSIDEQKRISDVLTGAALAIDGLCLQRDKLRLLKAGLMQDLLTGTRRVTAVLDADSETVESSHDA